MKKIARSRLPTLSTDKSELVKGVFDFLGAIRYSSAKLKDNSNILKFDYRDFDADMAVFLQEPILNSSSFEFPVSPQGLQRVLEYYKQVYGKPPIYVHENGQRTQHNSTLDDTSRLEYQQAYIGTVLDAIR